MMLVNSAEFPHVSIVMVNYNGWEYTIECLESLFQISYPKYDIILTDNGSINDSIEKIKDYCQGKIDVFSKFFTYNAINKPINIIEYEEKDVDNNFISEKEEKFNNIASNKKIRLITIKNNIKFTPGLNVSLRYIANKMKTDYILLLNNDTVVEKDFLKELVLFSEKYKKVGVLGPTLCLYDKPDKAQVPNLQNVKYPIEVDYVEGAAFLFRSDFIKAIGLFNPIYNFFYEEKDYCYRVKKAGFKTCYLPTKDKVYHKVGGDTNKVSGFRLFYMTRNLFIFNKLHLNIFQSFWYIVRYFIPNISLILLKQPKEVKSVLKGAIDGFSFVIKKNLRKYS